jgi:hypothetical protein
MSKQTSPYLSFRQAIRPAIFANAVLLREQERAGELAEAANQILTLTRDLLRKAGLGYIATAGPGAPAGDGGGLGRLDSVLEAFADAAMMWAQIVGNCLALADGLLDQGRLDEVQALAAVLEDSGESGTARQLVQRLAPAAMVMYKKRLGMIHARMKPAEIENAIDALTGALSDIPESPDRNIWLNSLLPALATSTLAYITSSDDVRGRVRYIASGRVLTYPNMVVNSISDIAAPFRIAASRQQ